MNVESYKERSLDASAGPTKGRHALTPPSQGLSGRSQSDEEPLEVPRAPPVPPHTVERMLVWSRRLLLLMLLADAAGVEELHYLCSMNGLQQARGHRTLPFLVAAALITPVQVRQNLSPFSVSCSQGSRLSGARYFI